MLHVDYFHDSCYEKRSCIRTMLNWIKLEIVPPPKHIKIDVIHNIWIVLQMSMVKIYIYIYIKVSCLINKLP